MRKRLIVFVEILFFLMMTAPLTLISCIDGSGNYDRGHSANEVVSETHTVDGVSFTMVCVPGGLNFPAGKDNDETVTVDDAFWIADTEVTYELWEKVYTWATSGSGATGAGQYLFANTGTMGDGTGDTNQHPVTTVNWRDCMVWCNALTEWYNAQENTSYECVYHIYTYDGTIIRDSRDCNHHVCACALLSRTADGFRLSMNDEYTLAALYRDGINWTYSDHVSGDDSGACFDDGNILGGLGMSTVFGDYAVYSGNSGSSTAVVKSKRPNALGLYDMSGNVFEWCFDRQEDAAFRIFRSGSWQFEGSYLQVGNNQLICDPSEEYFDIGFRFARTQ